MSHVCVCLHHTIIALDFAAALGMDELTIDKLHIVWYNCRQVMGGTTCSEVVVTDGDEGEDVPAGQHG